MNPLLNYSTIKQVTNGVWVTPPKDPEAVLTGGAFDTRSLGDAEIFFAWKGEASDGHAHIHQLANSQIRLIVVEQEVEPVAGCAILKVVKTQKALQQMAQKLASMFQGKIVAITGSVGKTTAKTWLSQMLENRFSLLTNVRSFNNHVGCPITVLGIKPEHELLILEMGMSGLGELELLSSIAPADITVLLNVGHAHIGKLGSRENIYKAKLEIFSHQRPDALSLLPWSDSRLKEWTKTGETQYFGAGSADYSWETVAVNSDEKSQQILFQTPWGEKTVLSSQLGPHVGDLLSCLFAICHRLGARWEDIEKPLETLSQEKGRSSFFAGHNGSTVLDDSYNANPESVINMLRIIASMEAKRRIGVIGNLAELDEEMKESADAILENIPTETTHLFLGGETGQILYPKIKNRYPKIQLYLIEDIEESLTQLKDLLDKESIVGVKGSRTSHMERFVYELTGKETQCRQTGCKKPVICNQCDEL